MCYEETERNPSPVAWLCAIVMLCAVDALSGLLCKLGIWLVNWVSSFSTLGIILFAMLFGSAFVGLFYWAMTLLPQALVFLSDLVYPSNHAFRYYFLGVLYILFYLLAVLCGILGIVKGGVMFWFYVKCAALIWASVLMMIRGKAAAEDRHQDAATL